MNEKEGFFSKSKYYIFLFVAILIVYLVWWYGGDFLWDRFGGDNHANLRGDAYGALNTLFSGLAFAGIIISILMQSEELRLQRSEMSDTRNEIKGQKDIMEAQLNRDRNQDFRSFIQFQIEGIRLLIKGIKAQGHNQGYRTFEGEDALTLIKFSAISIDGVVYQGFDKQRWLTQEGNFKLKGILKSISYFEEYIDKNYKGKNPDQKDFYYNLAVNELSNNLYELLIEIASEEEKQLRTLRNYI